MVRLTLLSTSGSKREELSASKLRPFLRVPFLQKLRVALRCESIPAHCKLGLLSGLHCAIRPSVAEARGLAASLPTAAQHAPLHPCTLQVGPSQWAALCRTPLCCRGPEVGCSFAHSSPARTSPSLHIASWAFSVGCTVPYAPLLQRPGGWLLLCPQQPSTHLSTQTALAHAKAP